MKKLFTSIFLSCALMSVQQLRAQNQPLTDGRIKSTISADGRFLVNTPASIAGLKRTTMASWGGQASTPLLNVPVVRGLDSLAALPLTNPSAISGKVALLFRGGGITFAQKAQYAVNAGAIAVIIVNNIPGDPVAMGNTGTATFTVPIIMVSDIDGAAINRMLLQSTPVTVSIGGWNLGVAHDLAILQAYQALPHAMSIPWSQLSVGANRLPYRNYVAGAVLNYGTSTETAIVLADTVRWNPTSGAPTVVHTDSVRIASIAPTDSVRFGFGDANSAYSLPSPTSTGYYSYNYSIKYPNTDAVPQDNFFTAKQYVTDSIFSKGTYDYVKGEPVVTLSIQPSGATSAFAMGPMYYMANGKYSAKKIQFTISKSAATTLTGEEAFGLLYKWTDGSNSQPLDSFAEGGELKLVAIAYKAFTTADSSGDVQTLVLRDPTSPTKTIVLDSNTWYWTAAQATSTCFIGVDENVSYFTRAYEQSQVYKYQEMPELLTTTDYTSLTGSATALAPFPFGGDAYNVDSTFYDRFYNIPAIAFHISKNQIGVGVEKEIGISIGTVKAYPSPANSFIKVDVQLNKSYNTVKYRLLDIAGHVVYKSEKAQIKNDSFTISSESIASGIYHLVVIADDDITTQRIVIQH